MLHRISSKYILPTHSLMIPMTLGFVLENIFEAGTSFVDYWQTSYSLFLKVGSISRRIKHIWISIAKASSRRSDFSGS